MNRQDELRTILDQGRYFKVVCGAGNEDPEEVYLLSLVYTLAGVLGIDVSANVDVVKASIRGVDEAHKLAPEMGITLHSRPFVNVSVGLKGDPHVRKATIVKENCSECGVCFENCDQDAIQSSPYEIIKHRCIGCGKCAEVCEFEAIEFYTRKIDFTDILPKCLEAGAETIELHAIIADDELVMKDWQTINEILPDQFVSMCLDRSQLSDVHLSDRISQASRIAGDRLIIQADGAPMSGGSDTYNTTLQAVACADIVIKSRIPAKILLSGGTNSNTGKLSKQCDLIVHGVSIGTFARNLIKDEIKVQGFDKDREAISRAVEKAKKLVDLNMEPLSRD